MCLISVSDFGISVMPHRRSWEAFQNRSRSIGLQFSLCVFVCVCVCVCDFFV